MASPSTPPPTDLTGVLRTLYRWRRQIIMMTAAGAVLSIIVALLLPSYFSGHTSFLVISPDQASLEGVFGTGNRNLQFYGNGDDIDRMLAVAESDELVDHMVNQFNLYEVYDIDTSKQKAPLYVAREFLDLYEVERTDRDLIVLSIEDRDPERAAEMAREARETCNRISLRLLRGTQSRVVDDLSRSIDAERERMSTLTTELNAVRSASGIYNLGAQGESLATRSSTLDESVVTTESRIESFQNSQVRGRRDSIVKLERSLLAMQRARENLDEQLLSLNGNMNTILSLEEALETANENMGDNSVRLRALQELLLSEQRSLEVVEPSKVPVAKSRPIRWLIVVISTVLSFVFALVGVLLIESGKRYDWKQITDS